MSNKFKAAAERQKVRPGGADSVIAPPVVEVQPEPVAEATPVVAPSENPLVDVFEKKAAGKTYSIHLSPAAIIKIDKTAKQLKCSRSKVLDMLAIKYL